MKVISHVCCLIENILGLPLRVAQGVTGLLTGRSVGKTLQGKITLVGPGWVRITLSSGEEVIHTSEGLVKTNPGFDTVNLVWRGHTVGWRICAVGLTTPEKVSQKVASAVETAKNNLLVELFGEVEGYYSESCDGPGAYSTDGNITLDNWLSSAHALGSAVDYDISLATSQFSATTVDGFKITGRAVTGGWGAAEPTISVEKMQASIAC